VGAVFVVWTSTAPAIADDDLDAAAAFASAVTLPLPSVPLLLPIDEPTPIARAAPGIGRTRAATTTAPVPQRQAGGGALLVKLIGQDDGEGTGTVLDELFIDDGTLDRALAGVTSAREASMGTVGPKVGHSDRGDAHLGVGLAASGTVVTSGAQVAVASARIEPIVAGADVEEGDAGRIADVLGRYSGRVTTCVEQSLKVVPDLRGRVGVGFTVRGGRVIEAHVASNSTGVAALGDCVVRSVRQVRFDTSVDAVVAEFPWAVSGR
jgi:hypothetical protein